MGALILSIDQGTTSTRAILFDPAGNILSISQKELKLYYPDNGWVEQDPRDIWADTQQVCRDVLKSRGIKPSQVAAIGITNQRETTIVWDRKTGEPVHNAVVWQDRRTANFCEKLEKDGYLEKVRARAGLLIDPYFSGTKIKWILDNVSGAKEKAKKGELAFGTMDCFLLWKMTGGKVHATDATNASRTMIFNIVKQEWDDDLLALLDIPRALLPQVKDCSGDFGKVTPDFIGCDVPVTGIAGDQQAALFGQACFSPGMVKSTYGTGCFALMNIGDSFRESKNRMLTTVAYRLNGKTTYAIEGAIFSAGAAIQWLRDGLGIIGSAAQTEEIARSVPDSGGVYLVPAFTGLGAPYWDPYARGALVGLTRDTGPAHFVRAALEALAYQTRDLLDALATDGAPPLSVLKVDGGVTANAFAMQFVADICEVTVERPAFQEMTALGAAKLAAQRGETRTVDVGLAQQGVFFRRPGPAPAAAIAQLADGEAEAADRALGKAFLAEHPDDRRVAMTRFGQVESPRRFRLRPVRRMVRMHDAESSGPAG